jgi:protein-disulfide isomerase
LCANDQGKFLEYHNYLFANNSKIDSIQTIKNFAISVGLSASKFDQCFDSGKYKLRAEELYNQGNSDFQKANIPTDKQGTPTFFINGEAIIGAVPYNDFVEIIEKGLNY